MVTSIHQHDPFITFEPKSHTYTDLHGYDYLSVTKFQKKFEVPFDAEGMSSRLSGGDPVKKQRLLNEWAEKGREASEHGTSVHGALEKFFLTGTIDEGYSKIVEPVARYFSRYQRNYAEKIYYSNEYRLCGTADLTSCRSTRSGCVIDITDYKTNLSKGIVFDSSYVSKGLFSFGNKYFLSPIDHMEECNYTKYALQISIYAYFAEVTYGVKIGRLQILFINKEMEPVFYPLPYLRSDVINMLNHYKNMKKL